MFRSDIRLKLNQIRINKKYKTIIKTIKYNQPDEYKYNKYMVNWT